MRSGPFLNVRNDEKLLQEAKQAAHGASAGRGTNTHHETPTHSPPLLKSNARTSTFQAWSDEQIREVCRRLERGMRIVVVWRFVPSDDDREPTIHTWLGEISRTGRGTSVEYDGELNADNKYEKWHTHTVTSILPNADIEVSNVQRIEESRTDRETAAEKSITAETRKKEQSSAPVPASTTPTQQLRVTTASSIRSASPIDWPGIMEQQNSQQVLPNAPPQQAEVEMDAEGDSSDDDDQSCTDSVEEQFRFWSSDAATADSTAYQCRAAQPGQLSCPTSRPARSDHRIVPAPDAPDGTGRTGSNDNCRAPTCPPMAGGKHDAGPAQCTVTERNPGSCQPVSTQEALEMDNNSNKTGHNPRSTGVTAGIREDDSRRTKHNRSSPPETLPGVAARHTCSDKKSERADRSTTKSSYRGTCQNDHEVVTTDTNKSLYNPHMDNGKQGRRHLKASSHGPQHRARSGGIDNIHEGKNCGETRSLHSQQSHPESPERSQRSSGIPHDSTCNKKRLPVVPEHQGRRHQECPPHDNRRQTPRAAKPAEGITAGAGCPGHAISNVDPVLRAHIDSDAPAVPGPWQEGTSTKCKHGGGCTTDVYRLNGKAAASWAELGRPGQKPTASLPPHLKPEAIGTVSWLALERLAVKAAEKRDYEEVMLWVNDGPYYEKIRAHIEDPNTTMRSIVGKMTISDAKLFADAKKFANAHASKNDGRCRARCNAFWRPEWEKMRRRSLIEPIINDVIDHINNMDRQQGRAPSLPYSVQYSSKDEIRRSVLQYSHAALADMASWFDQLPVAESIQPLFTIVCDDENTEYELTTTGMGFKPACKAAHKTLGIISPREDVYGAEVPRALFVDNAAFFGTEQQANRNMELFRARAKYVGAVLNKEDNAARTRYEFLGEAYDMTMKTRALTEKTAEKCKYIYEVLNSIKGPLRMRAKRALAIAATLNYACEILDAPLPTMYQTLSLMAQVGKAAHEKGTWDHNIDITVETIREMSELAALCMKNNPVHVVHGNKAGNEHAGQATTVFVDASAWGYGAVVKEPGTSGIKYISQQWNTADVQEAYEMGGTLQQSTIAEPLALRKILCQISARNLVIYTDHHGLVDALAANNRQLCGSASYTKAKHLINTLRCTAHIEVRFVSGTMNPADPLSRGRPPLLSVTRIGAPPSYNHNQHG